MRAIWLAGANAVIPLRRCKQSEDVTVFEKTCPACGTVFPSNRRSRVYCRQSCANGISSQRRQLAIRQGPVTTIWSCGGGVQSSAIAGLIVQGKLPKPDYSFIVDVGYEQSSTWETVHDVLQPALRRVGVELQILRTADYRENNLFDKGGYFRLPGYRLLDDGKVSKLHTHCSSSWKLSIIQRWARRHGIKNVVNWVGMSRDEMHRVKLSPVKSWQYGYPLIDRAMSRIDCFRVLWEMGWNEVYHSSCYCCPQQNNEEWIRTYAKYPDDWARAIAIDEMIRERDDRLYLHHDMLPLDQWIEKQRRHGYPGLLEPCHQTEACVECL